MERNIDSMHVKSWPSQYENPWSVNHNISRAMAKIGGKKTPHKAIFLNQIWSPFSINRTISIFQYCTTMKMKDPYESLCLHNSTLTLCCMKENNLHIREQMWEWALLCFFHLKFLLCTKKKKKDHDDLLNDPELKLGDNINLTLPHYCF